MHKQTTQVLKKEVLKVKFTTLWSKANVLASYLLGGKGEYRTVKLSCESEELTLPVTPWKYSVTTAQNNKVVDILDSGEALLFGNIKLKTLKFGCFFPNQESHEGHKYVIDRQNSPAENIDLLTKWKESKKPVRVIITDSPINLMMVIMTFNYNEKDFTGDVWYEISFTEYRELNTPAANNDKQINENTGLKERPTDTQESISKSVNNQATVVKERQTNKNGGFCLTMTDGIQAPHGCLGNMTNASQATLKGICNARDILEVSKAAYGTFKQLQTLKDKNVIEHLAIDSVREALQGGAFKI